MHYKEHLSALVLMECTRVPFTFVGVRGQMLGKVNTRISLCHHRLRSYWPLHSAVRDFCRLRLGDRNRCSTNTMTRILIVDDNAKVRAALRMCLKMRADWTVCGEAENGDAAIELVPKIQPDVVLLDYAMPVMNGLEAARVLSVLAPQCAILMYTMFATPQLSEMASAAGIRAVLSKDVNGIGAVMEAIDAVTATKDESLGASG